MAKAYVFYNTLAGSGDYDVDMRRLGEFIKDELVICDVSNGYSGATVGMEEGDYIVLCGGDGTLNRFANDVDVDSLENEILYFPTGSGNDFARELGRERGGEPFPVTEYLKNLPVVTVKGKSCRFINGIGYGIDGYCCEVGDELRKIPNKKINYTSIAIKGLLFHYKPTNARVTVDGVTRTYKKVWLAPTMYGRFYGGGMIPTPAQRRGNAEGTLSTLVFHGSGKLKTLMIFPSIFKGEHIGHTKEVEILSGHDITVEFDRPVALQIDGETVLGVTEYTAHQGVEAKVNA